jgi:hypothetical protein
MPVPAVNAFDPYAHPAGAMRRDKLKSAEFQSFAGESALDKPEEGAGFDGARRGPETPPDQQASPFEDIFALADSPPTPDSEAALPEDALDAQDLRAILEAAAHR